MTTQEAYVYARNNPQAARKAQETMQAILARSATDHAFREKLLTDPRAAIAEFSGTDITEVPETVNLVFIENEADATIVLPDFVDPEAELGEDELEAVAGGLVVTGTLVAGLMVTAGLCAIARDFV